MTPRELCELMVEFGLTRIRVDGVMLERPAGLATPKEDPKAKTAEDEPEDPFDRLMRMREDERDRALLLGVTR